MPNLDPKIAAQIAELRKVYRAALPDKLSEIRSAYDKICGDDADGSSAFEFYRLIHSLAGSGSIYGFNDIGDAAREVELLVKPFGEKRTVPDAACRKAIAKKMEILADAIAAGANENA